jgi:hypothetical protein
MVCGGAVSDVQSGNRPCKMAANRTTPLHLAVQEGRLEVPSGMSEGMILERKSKFPGKNNFRFP